MILGISSSLSKASKPSGTLPGCSIDRVVLRDIRCCGSSSLVSRAGPSACGRLQRDRAGLLSSGWINSSIAERDVWGVVCGAGIQDVEESLDVGDGGDDGGRPKDPKRTNEKDDGEDGEAVLMDALIKVGGPTSSKLTLL